VGADWKMWRRISLARSVMCMVAGSKEWLMYMVNVVFLLFCG